MASKEMTVPNQRHVIELAVAKNRSQREFQWISCAFKELCENSSITGLRYLVERNHSWPERIWWIFGIILSMYLSSRAIFGLKQQWDETPVIALNHAKLLSIGTIPFPAITLCPRPRISAQKFNFTQNYLSLLLQHDVVHSQDPKSEKLKRLKVAALMCYVEFAEAFFQYFHQSVTDDSIFKIINEISIGIDDALVACSFAGKRAECKHLFQNSMTNEGICFTFNSLSLNEILRREFTSEMAPTTRTKDWSFEESFKYNQMELGVEAYPFRAFRTGARGSLQIISKTLQSNIDKLCTGSTKGFRMMVHAPYEIPILRYHDFDIPYDRGTDILITPKVILPSNDSDTYSSTERKCYFQSERQLKFFKIYTQNNCLLECGWNRTLKECGCASIGVPRNKITKICDPAKKSCWKLYWIDTDKDADDEKCNCLPACSSTTYDISFFNFKYNSNVVRNKMYPDETMDASNTTFAQLRIAFSSDSYRATYLIPLYTRSSFLADCGGLFGLIMGASLLSFIEIVYFISLHGFCLPTLRKANARRSMVRRLSAPVMIIGHWTCLNGMRNRKLRHNSLN